MILLAGKRRSRKLQVGGSILGHGEGFVPIRMATPGFADTIKPIQLPRLPQLKQPRGGGKGSQSKLTADGFQSDIDYAFDLKNTVVQRMTDRAGTVGKDYYKSQEYKNDAAELNKVSEMIATLKTRKQNFLDILKGKKIDNNEYAIDGDIAFVYDKVNQTYELMELQDALGKKFTNNDGLQEGQYKIQTIGEARNRRAHDKKFNGFETMGQQLEELISNTPDKGDLHKLVQQAFKSANILEDEEESIIFEDGTKVNVYDLHKHMLDWESMRGEITTKDKTNQLNLERARQHLLNTILSKPGLNKAYRNIAVGALIRQGVDPSTMSPDEFQNKIYNEIGKHLASNMQYFLKSAHSEKFKAASKKKSTEADAADPEKVSIEYNSIYFDLMLPEEMKSFEYADYLPNGSQLLHLWGSSIKEAKFLDESYEPEKAHNIRNNKNLENIIDGDLEKVVTLANGMRLSDVYTGDGLEFAMVKKGQQPVILENVPVIQDRDGTVRIDEEFVPFVGLLTGLQQELIAAHIAKTGRISEDQIDRIKNEFAPELLAEKIPEFKAFWDRVNAPNSRYRKQDMIVFEVVVPELQSISGIFWGGDEAEIKKVYKETSGYDRRDYETYMAEEGDTDFGMQSKLYKTIVFAPVISKSNIKNANWDGVQLITKKQAALQRDLQDHYKAHKDKFNFDLVEDFIDPNF